MSRLINRLAPTDALDVADGATVDGTFETKIGGNNRITIGKKSNFKGSIEFQGGGNRVEIGANCNWRGKMVIKGDNQTVSFGDHSTTVEVYLLCQEGCDVRIGRWCMFSRKIEIRTTDAHSLIDRATGKRINDARSILIGDHVWIGVGALISKGTILPNDCIVGAASFVNGRFDEEGIAIAGVPARIVRRGVTWNRSRRAEYTEEEMNRWRTS